MSVALIGIIIFSYNYVFQNKNCYTLVKMYICICNTGLMNYNCDHIGTILMFYVVCGYSIKIFDKYDWFQ